MLNKSKLFTLFVSDYPPKPVKNFKCRSYNWENLKCTFSTQNTVNIPEYKLHFVVDRKPMQSSMVSL